MPTSTLVYLENSLLPSMLILYSAKNHSAYWLWVKDYIDQNLSSEKPNWKDQKTVTLKFSVENKLGYHSIDEIAIHLYLSQLGKDISPESLIELINQVSELGTMKSLLGVLNKEHLISIAEYLDNINEEELLIEDTSLPNFYWETDLFKNEITRNSMIDLTIRFAYAEIENGELIDSSLIISTLSRLCSPNQLSDLIHAWWTRWLKDPELATGLDIMADFFPASPMTDLVYSEIRDILHGIFDEELYTVNKVLEEYKLSGEESADDFIADKKSKFISWMLKSQLWSSAEKWIFEIFRFSLESQKIYNELRETYDWERTYNK
jgi:hypothetical protein